MANERKLQLLSSGLSYASWDWLDI